MSLDPQNLKALSDAVTTQYDNFIVSEVNESCLRLAVLEGEYGWHFHPESDELFLVLEGALTIDFLDREAITLYPNDVLTIPAGIVHKTSADERTVNLCVEHTEADTVFVDENASDS